MGRVLVLGVLVALAAAGCAVQPGAGENVGSRVMPIVDGEQVDGEEPAVVSVFNRAGGLCTGTLISPRVVLTAKHCVQSPGASSPSSPSAFIIGVGDSTRSLTEQFTVQAVETTPGVYTSSSTSGLGGELVGIDVAVLTLTTGAAIEPIPVHRGDPREQLREPAKAVGFGQTPDGTVGVKYRTDTSATGLMGGVIYTSPTICQGDSGGPLITADGEVFGVASFGTGDCGSGINGYNRVDEFLDMIDSAVGEAGDCLDNGEEVCDGFDNDCNDQVDEVCADLGESCETSDECVGGADGSLTCAETPSGKICTRPCNPLQPYVGCGADLYCQRLDGCNGVCVPGTAGSKGNDEPCEDDTECVSLFCADPGDGNQRCLTPCQGDKGMCFRGEVCAAAPGACNGCVPAAVVIGLRALGEPCSEDDDCGTGICFVDEGLAEEAAYCSRACADDSECPDRFHCRAGATESGGLCVRGDRPGVGAGTDRPAVGSGCIKNEDCSMGGFCATREGISWCSSFCETDEECPPNFTCFDTGEVGVCAPEGGLVGESCATEDDCISGLCAPPPGEEEPVCTRHCGPDVACSPGFECHRTEGSEGVCVEAAEAGSGSGGGGCSISGHPEKIGGRWAALVLALVALGLRLRRT